MTGALRYSIVIKPSVSKDIRRFPEQVLKMLDRAIYSLAENPFPPQSKKLNHEECCYRLRIGHYRILYEVTTDIRIITIVKIGHRKMSISRSRCDF